ncbi:hypothetical protein [Dictyobacter aurantiacus]|uniref:Three-Cys-motif partner protein TcmP n=1 Tax=Dictyobacter aurantiacus TaxID=1936993 RepID=A0A401ZDH7_9CHLR|nr:hypothetical protein [Dictyobacter aurantiacus]GCE04927.1 hypothetical protein KDAU_22560 [Dictyobacter aurantiacus]
MNLWTNTDEHDQTLTGATENGHIAAIRGARRLSDRAALSLLRSWLLEDFGAAYCRSLGASRIFRHCYWIDALGGYTAKSLRVPDEQVHSPSRNGKGRKKNADMALPAALQPGAMLTQALAQEDCPIALHTLLLSAGSSTRRLRESKQSNDDSPTLSKESGIIATSWLDAASCLLREIEQSPTIFLLDPLGPTTFSYDDLAPLYKRTGPTELCFLLAHKQIEHHLRSATTHTAQANALTALLRSDRWKTLNAKEKVDIQGFARMFITSMRRHFQWSPQSIDLPVQNGPASVTSLPYTLIYATRRSDGLLIMNDALCQYRRRTYRQSYQGVLSEDWFAQQDQKRLDEALRQLREQIQRQGVATRIRRWPDLRQQLILDNFGQFTVQEYDRCLQELIAQQEVRCAWRQAPEEGSERIPGNEDTLIWR